MKKYKYIISKKYVFRPFLPSRIQPAWGYKMIKIYFEWVFFLDFLEFYAVQSYNSRENIMNSIFFLFYCEKFLGGASNFTIGRLRVLVPAIVGT